MSQRYNVIDSTVPTFVTLTIIDWVDLFIRPPRATYPLLWLTSVKCVYFFLAFAMQFIIFKQCLRDIKL